MEENVGQTDTEQVGYVTNGGGTKTAAREDLYQ